jgi:predicted component of type VI protein secretion system
MKNKILDFHPILGAITYNDLINDLSSLLKDYNTLEETIQDILKNNNYDEYISSLLNDNISNRLEWLLFVLKSLL